MIDALRALGHDVEHVYSKALSGKPDPDVRALAEAEDRMLVKQDIRFSDAPAVTPGAHPGFVLVRLKQEGLRAVITKLRAVFETEDVDPWRGCFVVIGESKVRMRRTS